jgi:hypothetical protein
MARLARNLTLTTVAIGIVCVTLVGFAFERVYERIEKSRKGNGA